MSKHHPILVVSDLTFAYGERVLFDGLSFSLSLGERVGLIGDNGVGKSTLLKLIAWHAGCGPEGTPERPVRGDIAIRNGIRVGLLEQVPSLPKDVTIRQVLESAFSELSSTIVRWEKAIAEMSPQADALYAEVERLGGFDFAHKVDAIHAELDLPPMDRLIGTLSGGQMKRVAIGKLALEKPDVVLYDEPTNHLDVETIEWLERYIANSPAASLIVTHDRAFLDSAVSVMAELRGGRRLTGNEGERGALAVYPGNYEDYLEARALEEEQRAALGQSKSQLLKNELEWSRRMPKARTTKSQARLDRVDALKQEVKDLSQRAVVADFDFGSGAPRLSKHVLSLEGASFGYGPEPLATHLDLTLQRGERLGVIGRNGIGKTSLLKVLNGELPLLAGTLNVGLETKIAVFDQHRTVLDPKASIQSIVAPDGNDTVFPGGKPTHVAAWLARFAFSARHLSMAVEALSGGERNRLALARFLLEPANVMLLDEPTNDLDLQTLSILEEALIGFGGTVVVVSHDRWFLDRVATRLMVFEDLPPKQLGGEPQREVFFQPGGWTSYRRLRADEVSEQWDRYRERLREAEKARREALQPKPVKSGLTSAEKKELKSLEGKIEKGEARIAELDSLLADSDIWNGDGAQGRKLDAERQNLQEQLDTWMMTWAELAERA